MPEYAHNFQNVTSVGIGAFANATFSGAVNLSNVEVLPDATWTEDRPAGADHDYGVFEGSNFSSGNFQDLTYIGSRAFFDCKLPEDLVEVSILNFPNVTEVGESAFENVRIRDSGESAPTRTFISMPKIRTIGERSFYNSTIGLVSVKNGQRILDLPECRNIGQSAFNHEYQQWGIKVDRIYLPKLLNIGMYAFRWLSKGNTGRLEIHINKDPDSVEEDFIFHRNILHLAPKEDVYLFLYSEIPPSYNIGEGRPSLNTDGDISGDKPWTENSWHPARIYVPYGCATAYKNSTLFEPYGNIYKYGDFIEEMPQNTQFPYNPFQ